MRVAAVLCLFAAASALRAQETAPPDPAELLRSKLASPFLEHADWTTDYDEARRRAHERGQLVFGYFTTAGY